MSRRRPLFSTTIGVDEIRRVTVIDNDGVPELVIDRGGWWAVEVPLDEERIGAGTTATLRRLVERAAQQGAAVSDDALDALRRAA